MEAPAAPLSARAPGPTCPGCGKSIDPLRAGHVAVYDGVFLYYCDQSCKASHLRVIASHLGDDVPTMDPPAVAMAVAAANGNDGHRAQAVEPVVSTLPPVSHERAIEAPLAAEGELEALAAPEPIEDDLAADDFDEEPAAAPLAAPQTLRSPTPSPTGSEAPSSVRPAHERALRATALVSLAGGVAGVLVPLLAIADVSLAVRLVFGALAASALVLRLVIARRQAPDAHPLVAAVPAVGALVAAIAAQATGHRDAASIAVLAGLAAAVALGVEEAIAVARRDVDGARARAVGALDVSSRVARGDAPSVTTKDVKAGEAVLVEAGDVIGVDGVVAAGEAVVVPWASAPIEITKVEGDAVVAGARVVSGRARIVTAWAAGDRAWMRATSSPSVRADVAAPIAAVARALLERGAPAAALVAAIATMAYGGGASWIDALAAACAVGAAFGGRGVVAAVALVLARAQMKALAHGVVYKDARAFDAAGRTATAVVCSRGTVLTGEPEIVALEALGPDRARVSESHILALAAGAETASTHPFANAILRAARTRGVRAEGVRSATVHAGLGVTALASSGEPLVVGSRALLLQEKVSVAVVEARASELEAQGRSVLLVALAGKLVGLVALQDGLRAGARAAVQRLLDARIEPVLLSGESRETCETIARTLDIDHVRPEVLPADRGAEVRALAEGGHVVAVIGHPASDDGALGAADVAVAMGAAGHAAGEWGIALASDDVRDAALALSLAHAARDRARATLAIGLAPGAVALLAIVFGAGPLVCGPVAMVVAVGLAMGSARRAD